MGSAVVNFSLSDRMVPPSLPQGAIVGTDHFGQFSSSFPIFSLLGKIVVLLQLQGVLSPSGLTLALRLN